MNSFEKTTNVEMYPELDQLLADWEEKYKNGTLTHTLEAAQDSTHDDIDGADYYIVRGEVEGVPVVANIRESGDQEVGTFDQREYQVKVGNNKWSSAEEQGRSDEVTDVSPVEKKLYFFLCKVLGVNPHE